MHKTHRGVVQLNVGYRLYIAINSLSADHAYLQTLSNSVNHNLISHSLSMQSFYIYQSQTQPVQYGNL